MSPVLRDYQAEALAAIRGAAGRGITRALVALPTGAGKTVVFAESQAGQSRRTVGC